MPSGSNRTNNLHKWIASQYTDHKQFLAELRSKHGRESRYLPERIAASYKDENGAENYPLSEELAELLVKYFGDNGLTKDLLNEEHVERSYFVVLANVSFKPGKRNTMNSFIDKVFNDPSNMVISAFPVLGDVDCIFTLHASMRELEEWLWNSLRHDYSDIVSNITTRTYQTYSAAKHRNIATEA